MAYAIRSKQNGRLLRPAESVPGMIPMQQHGFTLKEHRALQFPTATQAADFARAVADRNSGRWEVVDLSADWAACAVFEGAE